jgi:hypothetical protein
MQEETKRLKMYYLDYTWDLGPNGIILDEELNTDKLGWKHGDHFEFINVNGRQILRKVDPLVAFTKGYRVNFGEQKNG